MNLKNVSTYQLFVRSIFYNRNRNSILHKTCELSNCVQLKIVGPKRNYGKYKCRMNEEVLKE